jgi:hypothetical protein
MSTLSLSNAAISNAAEAVEMPETAQKTNLDDFELETGKACRIDNPDCESCQ